MSIHVNQVGYFPNDTKTAVFTEGSSFEVRNAIDDSVIFRGTLSEKRFDDASGDQAVAGDFSEVKAEGEYYLCNDKNERSCHFSIKGGLYRNLKRDVLKAFYYQRCGCALEKKYAGIFEHKVCHSAPVTELSGDSKKRFVCGGWHDAGDYGRYSTAAAVALSHMLYGYLLFPEQWTEETGIPESGNGVPDLLNECRYELEWLLQMQKEDGSVYHKLTSMQHADFVLPEEDLKEFFLFPVSTMAAADFAAIMSLASRVYGTIDEEFSKKMLTGAKKAWGWLLEHPELIYERNPEGCNTGSYFDMNDTDERAWAAAELLAATGEKQYEEALLSLLSRIENPTIFGWGDVSGLAGLAVLTDKEKHAEASTVDIFMKAFQKECDQFIELKNESPYEIAMETRAVGWGSNMTVLNRAMLLSVTSRLTGSKEYHNASVYLVDYILGRNALDVSYVTGYGEGAYAHPHNRPTVALGDKAVMAGWLSGGPNGHPADVTAKENLPEGTPPMRCFVDKWECYSLNEITIYWNSLMVFMTAYMMDYNK